MIHIVGHKNPDTDSIVSAIVMADYFQKIGKQSKALRVGKINKETKFVLNKAKIKLPSLVKNLSKKKVFLVDHNEAEQAGTGIERAEIFGILDHHKLGGGMKTKEPIYVRIEPIGSTSTLVFNLFQEKKIQLKKNQAFLLLSGIISDTLKLTSPTTTKEDKKAAEILARISQEDIDALSQEIFKIRSDISGIKLEDLIFSDYKEYKEENLIFGIGLHETLSPEVLLKKEKEIFSILEKIKKGKKLDLIFFALVDILKRKTYFFLPGDKEKEIAEKAFKKRAKRINPLLSKENLLLLPGVVSRKKQIVPSILKVL
ncbi:MAG: manganese-dependent inorganic pyrophosphatase [bacterium]|nr:manganese-dependent inorganic pyrophosphatase [bacterium]